MKNLYTTSTLLSFDEFKRIEKAFEEAWSKETVFPELKNVWTNKNTALGQCAITALIIYDLFGGKIIYDKANFHLWNELPDGSQQDVSRKQFLENRVFTIYKYKTKRDILTDKVGEVTEIKKRYELLKSRFEDALAGTD